MRTTFSVATTLPRSSRSFANTRAASSASAAGDDHRNHAFRVCGLEVFGFEALQVPHNETVGKGGRELQRVLVPEDAFGNLSC